MFLPMMIVGYRLLSYARSATTKTCSTEQRSLVRDRGVNRTTDLRVMSPFQIETGAKAPQTTPRKLALLDVRRLWALFGSRWEQLPG